MLWRMREVRRMALANHSWAEVFRTRTTSDWYRRTGMGEGTGDHGCWFLYLPPPYSRGTGIFVNTGPDLVVPGPRRGAGLLR